MYALISHMSAGEDLVHRKDVLQMGKVWERGGERREGEGRRVGEEGGQTARRVQDSLSKGM